MISLVITVMIAMVLKDAAKEVFARLMHAVDPALVTTAETTLTGTPGVEHVGPVKLRWIGHRMHAEADVVVNPELSVSKAHDIAVAAEHGLIHAVPKLASATIHTDPHIADAHQERAHHR